MEAVQSVRIITPDVEFVNLTIQIFKDVYDNVRLPSLDFMGDGWSYWNFYAFGLCICVGVLVLLGMRARTLRVSKVATTIRAEPTTPRNTTINALPLSESHVMERSNVDGCPCGHCSRLKLLATYKFMLPAQTRRGTGANRA